MRSVMLTLGILGVVGLLASRPALAERPHVRLGVSVAAPADLIHEVGHHGYHKYRHGDYGRYRHHGHPGWRGPAVYRPPVWGHPPVVIPYPGHPPVMHPPVHRYRYHHYYAPRGGFVYHGRHLSLGIGF